MFAHLGAGSTEGKDDSKGDHKRKKEAIDDDDDKGPTAKVAKETEERHDTTA